MIRSVSILVPAFFLAMSAGAQSDTPQVSVPALKIGSDKVVTTVPKTAEKAPEAAEVAKPAAASPVVPPPAQPIENPNAPIAVTPAKSVAGAASGKAPAAPAAPGPAIEPAAAEGTAAVAPQARPRTPKPPPDVTSVGASKKPYVIGPLDVLEIKVWNDAKLSGMYDVRTDGFISMFLIGQVQAAGLTVDDLRDSILDRLSAVMNTPEVNIQVARINSKKYYVFGEVGRSGEFPLTSEMTVLDALSNTGGFREFANPKKIYILRGTKKLNFNYNDVSKGKNMQQNITIENGDRIFVP